jgi:uncharacterized protein
MNYLIIGGTGYIGRNLVKKLITEGQNIFVHTRDKDKAFDIFGKQVVLVNWDDLKHNPLNLKQEAIDCVINLAGESLSAHRWSPKTKSKITNSRINSTRKIIDAIEKKILNPKVLINASAIGYYGSNNSDILNEKSPSGNDFLAKVCRQWEAEAIKAEQYGVRVVMIRTGIVLGKEGALKKMLPPYKYYVGGSLGNGKQWMSWIHIDDLVNIYINAFKDNNFMQAVNATAPNAVTMKEFSQTLGNILHRPSILKVPSFIIKTFLGEMSDIVLKGQRVFPEKLIINTFVFRYSQLEDALKDILKN